MIFELILREQKEHLKARGIKRKPIKITRSFATGYDLEKNEATLRQLLREATRDMEKEYLGWRAMEGYKTKKK